jgi:transcriptional regulator of acetoin/glycerol metabolism
MSQLDPSDRFGRQRSMERAWERYVRDGVEPTGVGDEIVRSWRRARHEYRIDPALTSPIRRLTLEQLGERTLRDDVLRLARPILADFSARLGLQDHVLAYFDAEGVMLSIDGTPAVVESVAEIDFRPGVSWSEDAAGTNGPGTALAEGRPVEVFASEHFVAAWQPWSCAAAPILVPGSARPVGVVDVTGPWAVQRRHALLAVKAIARAVEERLRAAASVRDEVVRYAFRAATASGDALVAVDARGTVLAVNDAAARRRLVEAGALQPAIRRPLRTVLGRDGADPGGEIRLDPSEDGLVASLVTHEGAVIGAILRAPPPALRPSRARPGPAAPAAGLSARYDFDRILGDSPSLSHAVGLARVAARNGLPVTILGESGTGKELFAHAIHAASGRAAGPFVAVNCGAIPGQLMEAELFGYESGTFTGGRRDGSPGRFEDASGGTLFLDEVSELSPAAQTALLRVLQEKEVVRLGGSAPRRVDVRVVAASNKPLEAEIEARRFRRDLYYRLHVLPIAVPPLRDRRDDVVLLAQVFLAEAEAEVGRLGLELAPAAVEALRAHRWPGNVRELRNVVLRAAATAPAALIGPDDLGLPPPAGDAAGRPVAPSLRGALRDRERGLLLETLAACDGNVSRAAARLGVSRMTLYRRFARCGVPRPRGRGDGGDPPPRDR